MRRGRVARVLDRHLGLRVGAQELELARLEVLAVGLDQAVRERIGAGISSGVSSQA